MFFCNVLNAMLEDVYRSNQLAGVANARDVASQKTK